MELSLRALGEAARTPGGRKALKYCAVSAISIVISQVTLFVTFNALRLSTAGWCQVIATAVSTVPAYTLNRRWAWGKRGRSHLLKEVLPFWVVAFIGLAFSVFAVDLASDLGHHFHLDHLGVGVAVQAASLASYGILWVGKFIIFNRLLFVDRAGYGGGPVELDELQPPGPSVGVAGRPADTA